ncbi:MAG: serine hydrolase domain-containing protein [Candidatus Thorarchaeota archaeon]|jgi:CubicO group peptidase (beta-lactamase class C family)
MKPMNRKLVATLLSFLICLCAWSEGMPVVAPEEVGLSSERLERLTRAMEKGVEAEHFPGAVAAIARKGKIAYFETYGYQDREGGVPMDRDAIFRLASMTKAITGVAVMMLHEEGRFFLNDPVARFIPSFRDVQVAANGKLDSGKQAKDKDEWSGKDKDDKSSKDKKEWTQKDVEDWLAKNNKDRSGKDKESAPNTVPANRPITIRDLLRHTSGITYPSATIYEEGMDLGEMIDRLATVPLVAQPGTTWEYGMSTDVLARLVEVVSGMSFDDFLEERIFDPLGMKDTAFYVPKEKHARLVKIDMSGSEAKKKTEKWVAGDPYLSPPAVLGGGSGLVSTTMDYLRFCQMLLNNGELDGVRILGRKSVEMMHMDHMGDVDLNEFDPKLGYEPKFGLTFGVRRGPEVTGQLGSEGAYYWAGAAGTSFWIDPKEELVGVFMLNGINYNPDSRTSYSQLMELFTYQAIVD